MSMAQIKLGNLLWRSHTRPISPEDPVDVKDVNTADIKAKLEMVQSELALVKAELQEIKANQLSGDQKVQLSGTIVEEVVLVNAMALRDTNRRPIFIDGSQYRSMVFVIRNTLDADVRFMIRPMGPDLGHRFYYHDGTEIVHTEAMVTIPSYAGYNSFAFEGVLPRSFPIVRGGTFHVAYDALNVPTTGTLSVWLEGVRI